MARPCFGQAGPDRDSFEVCGLLSCGLIVYMLSRFQRGRVCVCVFVSSEKFTVPEFMNTLIEIISFPPPPSQRGNIVAMIMCHELSGPISAPWPAPRREQKADLHRLMSGTVCFLTAHMKHEKCFWEFTQGKSLVPFLQASLVFFFFYF